MTTKTKSNFLEGKSVYFITDSSSGEILKYKKEELGCMIVNVQDNNLQNAIKKSLDYQIDDYNHNVNT